MSTLDPSRRAIALGLGLALLAGAAVDPATLAHTFAALARGHAFLSLSVAASFVVHAWLVPADLRRRDLVLGVGLEAVFAALRALSGAEPALGVGTGLGAAALARRLSSLARAGPEERPVHARALFDMLAIAAFAILTQPALALTGRVHPVVWDAYAIHVEEGFGAQPSFLVGRLFEALPPLALVSGLVYLALPVGVALVHGARERRAVERGERDARPEVLIALFVIGLVGYPLYFAFPMVGPAVFTGGPWPAAIDPGAFPLEAAAIAAEHPRNCMPSLHTAWALSLSFQARLLSPGLRRAALGWTALTLLATLGLGEHYLVDLVAAAPLAVALDALGSESLGASRALRSGLAALALGVLALWCTAIRLGHAFWESWPAAVVGASIATVVLAAAMRRALLGPRSGKPLPESPRPPA